MGKQPPKAAATKAAPDPELLADEDEELEEGEVKIDETIPGGRTLNASGQLQNSEGQLINEDGSLVTPKKR